MVPISLCERFNVFRASLPGTETRGALDWMQVLLGLRPMTSIADTLMAGSDARVPETTVLGCQPGDVFVHRGIANLFTPTDDSLNAVMMIALQNFKVKHIVICGHSNCVGCQTSLRASVLPHTPPTQAIQRYLAPLTALARNLASDGGPPTLDLLVEENVIQQVKNIVNSDPVRTDWQRRGADGVVVHGWVYQLEDGTVRDLDISQGPPGHVPGQSAAAGW